MLRFAENRRRRVQASLGCLVGMALGCTPANEISLLGLNHTDAGHSGGAADVVTDAGAGGAGASSLGAGGTGAGGADVADSARGCRSNAGCAQSTPFCDVSSGACVACLVDSNCPTYLCDVAQHTCARCARSADCHSDAPYCDDDDGRCVQCVAASQCAIGQVCVAEAHACAARCVTQSDCAGGDRPLCAASAGVCVECTSNADCVDESRPEFCDLNVGSCVSCLVDSDCPSGHCTTTEKRCVP